MNSRAAIDLTATVTTPENIQFEYRLAGPFRRLPAFIVDLIFRGLLISTLFVLISCSGIATTLSLSGTLMIVAMILTYFFFDWFYGLVFEAYWNGKTPGKYLTKIQVLSVDGRPISAYQATIRNFLRLADMAPMMSLEAFDPDAPPIYWIPTGLVAVLCMLFTQRFQRLGDLAAGTMVVVDERTWVPPNVKLEDPRVESLAELIPANFRMSRSMGRAIALYAERRSRMPMVRRMELSAILAKPLMKQFEFRDDTSPDLLLCALYYREFVVKPVVDMERKPSPSPSKVLAPPPPAPLQIPSEQRKRVMAQAIDVTTETSAQLPVVAVEADTTDGIPPIADESPPVLEITESQPIGLERTSHSNEPTPAQSLVPSQPASSGPPFASDEDQRHENR
jgi:uncharacterized RDD family membrane protein YckC